jgi:hypothetical protein
MSSAGSSSLVSTIARCAVAALLRAIVQASFRSGGSSARKGTPRSRGGSPLPDPGHLPACGDTMLFDAEHHHHGTSRLCSWARRNLRTRSTRRILGQASPDNRARRAHRNFSSAGSSARPLRLRGAVLALRGHGTQSRADELLGGFRVELVCVQ